MNEMKLIDFLKRSINEIFRTFRSLEKYLFDLKNYYILWSFLGCIIYAVVLFVINAAPSLSLTTAARLFILMSTTKNKQASFFNIFVLFFILYHLRPMGSASIRPY